MSALALARGGIGSAEIGGEGMDAARAFLDMPLQAARDSLKWTEQSMQGAIGTMHQMLDCLARATAQAHSARDLQDLGAIQWRLGNEEFAHAAQGAALEFLRWCSAGAQVLERMPALPMLAPNLPEAHGIDALAPLAAFNDARRAWTQYWQQWAYAARGAIPS